VKCKFCGTDTTLIKAHIIPDGFFRRIKQGKVALKIITNKVGEYPKNSPIGIYDNTIVCAKCETIWQEWDNYTQQLLTDMPLNSQLRYHNNEKLCYVIENYDYKKLKLFFISMCWRASASTHPFFSKVKLGILENLAKNYVVNADPGCVDDFGVILAKFDHPIGKSTLDPHEDVYSGVNFFRFYLASYIAYIKIDAKSLPQLFSKLAVSENQPLYIICRDFTKSKELNLVVDLVKNHFTK
jgi:hypothetical protein